MHSQWLCSFTIQSFFCLQPRISTCPVCALLMLQLPWDWWQQKRNTTYCSCCLWCKIVNGTADFQSFVQCVSVAPIASATTAMVERHSVASLVHTYNKDEWQLLSLREILCTLILRFLGVGVMLSSCIHLQSASAAMVEKSNWIVCASQLHLYGKWVSSSLSWGELCILVFETLAMELIKSSSNLVLTMFSFC